MKWKDQGWGNRKGRIGMRLMRNYETINQNENIFDAIAPHDFEEREITIQANDGLLTNYMIGDTLDILYSVGGGGGHSLNIAYFTLVPVYREIQSNNMSIAESNIQKIQLEKEI